MISHVKRGNNKLEGTLAQSFAEVFSLNDPMIDSMFFHILLDILESINRLSILN